MVTVKFGVFVKPKAPPEGVERARGRRRERWGTGKRFLREAFARF